MRIDKFDHTTRPELFLLQGASGAYDEVNEDVGPSGFAGALRVLKVRVFEGVAFLAIHSEKIQVHYQKDAAPAPVLIAEAELIAEVETTPGNWAGEVFSFGDANLSKVNRNYRAVIVKDLPGLGITDAVFAIEFVWQFPKTKLSFYLDVPGRKVRLRWRVRAMDNALSKSEVRDPNGQIIEAAKKGLRYSVKDYKGNVSPSGQVADPENEPGWHGYQWIFEPAGFDCAAPDARTPLQRFEALAGLFVDPTVYYDFYSTYYDVYADGWIASFTYDAELHLLTIYDPADGTTVWFEIGFKTIYSATTYSLGYDTGEAINVIENHANRVTLEFVADFETSAQGDLANESASTVYFVLYPDRIFMYAWFNASSTFDGFSPVQNAPHIFVLSNTTNLTGEGSVYESGGSESTAASDGQQVGADYIATISNEINAIARALYVDAGDGNATESQYIDQPGVNLLLGLKGDTGTDIDGPANFAAVVVLDSADRIGGMKYDTNTKRLSLGGELNDFVLPAPNVGSQLAGLGYHLKSLGSDGFSIDGALQGEPAGNFYTFDQTWDRNRDNPAVVLDWPFISGSKAARSDHLAAHLKCEQFYNTNFLKDEVSGDDSTKFDVVTMTPPSYISGNIYTAQASTADQNISVTIPAAADICIVAMAYRDSTADDPDEIYWNSGSGMEFTEIGIYEASGNGVAAAWYMTKDDTNWPDTGAHTLHINSPGGGYNEGANIVVFFLDDVDVSGDPIIGTETASTGSTAAQISNADYLDPEHAYNCYSVGVIYSYSATPANPGFPAMDTIHISSRYNNCFVAVTGKTNYGKLYFNNVDYGSMLLFSVKGVYAAETSASFPDGFRGKAINIGLNDSAIRFNPNDYFDVLNGAYLLRLIPNFDRNPSADKSFHSFNQYNFELLNFALILQSGNGVDVDLWANKSCFWALNFTRGLPQTHLVAWHNSQGGAGDTYVNIYSTHNHLSYCGEDNWQNRVARIFSDNALLLNSWFEGATEADIPCQEIMLFNEAILRFGGYWYGNGEVEPAVAQKEIIYFWDCVTTGAWAGSFGSGLSEITMSANGSPTLSTTKKVFTKAANWNSASEYYYNSSVNLDFDESAGLTIAFWFLPFAPSADSGLVKVYGNANNYVEVVLDATEQIFCNILFDGTSVDLTPGTYTLDEGALAFVEIRFDFDKMQKMMLLNGKWIDGGDLEDAWTASQNITRIDVGNFLAGNPAAECYADMVYVLSGAGVGPTWTAAGKPLWLPYMRKDGVLQQKGDGYEANWTVEGRVLVTGEAVTGG